MKDFETEKSKMISPPILGMFGIFDALNMDRKLLTKRGNIVFRFLCHFLFKF